MKKFTCQAQKMSGVKPIVLLLSLILISYFYAAAAEKKFSDNFSGSTPGNWNIGNDGGGKNNARPVTVTIDKAETPADAVLKGNGSISGHVTGTSGNPLQSAWVGIYNLNYFLVTATATNSSGNYTTNSIPAGNYKVEFDVSTNYIGKWYDDKSSFYTADPVTVKTGQDTPGIDAQLALGTSISGRVTDGTDGIAYVYVCLYDPDYNYVSYDYTDYNGYYQITALLPGSYKVNFANTGDFVSEWYNDRSDFYSADPVTLAPEETIELEDAVLTMGGTITGQVTDTYGTPANNVWVKVYNLDYNYVNGTSTTYTG
jgi:protocatechuate 3,4-dioxygenase beta subunit